MQISREPVGDMYQTTNNTYGTEWQTSFSQSFTQSQPYKSLTNARQVKPKHLPKDTEEIFLTHNPEHPCGIMTMSNVPTNTRGEFTNTQRDNYGDRQGLWSNACHNTMEATIDRSIGTYSNLQGAWSRMGASTYDSIHGNGPWVGQWQTTSYEPATLRTLYDHPNVNPRHNMVPIENYPQNM